MLPPSCRVISSVIPTTTFTLSSSNSWALTDVTSSFTLSKQNHAIIMYQFSGDSCYIDVVMRLSIDSDTVHVGNFVLWQGPLSSGQHTVSLDYRTPQRTVYTVSADREWV